MDKTIVAGIDAGSTAIKLVFYDGNRMEQWICPSGWDPRKESAELLAQAAKAWGIEAQSLAYIVGTGYGRASLSFITKPLTEISCHARGAAHLRPGTRTVIDIGGQDAKAIKLEDGGRVSDFVMNDKCAAGTGRFLQVIAHALGLELSELSSLALERFEPCKINAMCTVFAESEVIGLVNQGHTRQAIMAGILKSVAARTSAMAARIAPEPPLLFTGGVSQNNYLRQALSQELNLEVSVPDNAVFAGAVGAALFAWDAACKSN